MLRRYLFSTIIPLLCSLIMVNGQDCGPSCPVCSGSGNNTGALLTPKTLLASGLYIPTGDEEIGVLNMKYGLFKWLDVGIGYTVKAERPIWGIRFQPIFECDHGWRPGLIWGTGSVQIGESDQSVFIQMTKARELNEWFSLRLFGGLAAISPDFKELYGLGGITMTITDRFSPFCTYDGSNFHLGLSWIPVDWLLISGLLLEAKDPAVSVGFRWNFNSSILIEEYH